MAFPIPNLNSHRKLYTDFRSPANSTLLPISLTNQQLSKVYDEPTYLTFALAFSSKNVEANINSNYDKFPMPLFNNDAQDFALRNDYSTLAYLEDIKEPIRAKSLERFINNFFDLQNNFQWYFQRIDGLENLLTVKPESGIRVNQDSRITITTLEGLDMRVSQLMNMYRKIAFDDVYQRWMLPDMMRYFALDIYITEFRTFHRPNLLNPTSGNSTVQTTILEMMQNIMPTWVLHCDYCEFDITSINRNITSLNVTDAEQMEYSFDIKVGRLEEELINPALDYYHSDRVLNGLERTRIKDLASKDLLPNGTAPGNTPVEDAPPFDPLTLENNSRNAIKVNTSIQAQGQLLAPVNHIPGTPYNQQTGFLNLDNSSPNAAIDAASINPTQPNTWFGNALTFGKAFATNFVEDKIEKATVTKIPGLGISVNEAIAAVESKNFVTAFGLIRQAINKTFLLTAAPSSELGDEIVDGTFRSFLEGVSQSEATNSTSVEIIQFADLALSDGGTFERIKDFSLATNLTGRGEQNIPVTIEGGNAYASNNALQTNNDRSLATDLDGDPLPVQGAILLEGVPTSAATNNKLQG